MKRKKINKKLALNKNTVANLGDREMGAVNGGGEWTVYLTNCQWCDTLSVGDYCISKAIPCPSQICLP